MYDYIAYIAHTYAFIQTYTYMHTKIPIFGIGVEDFRCKTKHNFIKKFLKKHKTYSGSNI